MTTLNATISVSSAVDALCVDLGILPKDREYLNRRLRAEGIKFCTITMPQLAKSVLRSLEIGSFERPTAFRWKGRSLCFLHSLLVRIFDRNGLVRSDADAEAIYTIRQLCDYVYKLAFDFSDEEIDAACSKFVETDSQVLSAPFEDEVLTHIVQMRKNFLTYYPKTSSVKLDEILEVSSARSGPGSFAKHSGATPLAYYQEKLSHDIVYPNAYNAHIGGFRPYPASSCFGITYTTRISDERKCSEVLFVPKDSRGPRTIAREPQFNLMAQMAYFDKVSSMLEKESKYTINFTSQDINRNLVRDASVNRLENCTIDLKEGSDRISHGLVMELFRYSPGLTAIINLARSTHSVLPNGVEMPLRKLAGMGSGFTFPTMALVIQLTIATYVTKRTGNDFQDVVKKVFVYGDDIIVPTGWYSDASKALELVGLMVNKDKSFVLSNFRESCGADYYKGVDVTPVRLRLSNAELGLPRGELSFADAGIVQLERHCRELKKSGLWNLAEYYYGRLEEALGPLPTVANDSPVLGRYIISDTLIECDDVKVKSWIVKTISKPSFISPVRYLGKRLSHTRTKAEELLLDLQPLTDLFLVDVPKGVRLRKRLVYDTCFYGM